MKPEGNFSDVQEPKRYKIKSAVSLNRHLSPDGTIKGIQKVVSEEFNVEETRVNVKEVRFSNIDTQSRITFTLGLVQLEDTLEEIENRVDEALSGSEVLTSVTSSSSVISTQP